MWAPAPGVSHRAVPRLLALQAQTRAGVQGREDAVPLGVGKPKPWGFGALPHRSSCPSLPPGLHQHPACLVQWPFWDRGPPLLEPQPPVQERCWARPRVCRGEAGGRVWLM